VFADVEVFQPVVRFMAVKLLSVAKSLAIRLGGVIGGATILAFIFRSLPKMSMSLF